MRRIALVGSPNAGKTSLFNALTGLRHRVGNYPGVTVEHIEGVARLESGPVSLIDLPGTYSLEPLSADERVAVDVLAGTMPGVPRPDAVVAVVDASHLERSLPMVAELLAFGLPTIVALTMIDEVKANGGSMDRHRLERRLGVPVVGVVGNRGIGIDDLRHAMGDPKVAHPSVALLPDAPEAELLAERVAWAGEVASECVHVPTRRSPTTERLDRVLLHRVAGPAIFAVIMLVFFQLIFTVAAPLQDIFEGAVLAIGGVATAFLPEGWVQSLVVDGVIAGVGGVVVFVPQIAILLLLIALLEATGYLARAAFLVDRVMGWVGLEGRSFVALLSSYACAVPGIMAARSVPDPRARLVTILVAPLMTCSARLPVYTLLIAAFVPRERVFGVLGLQGLVMFGLYLLGGVAAMLAAAVLTRRLRRGRTVPFYMELPPYRCPMLRAVLHRVWRGVSGFLRKAGTIILAASIALWALFHFPEGTGVVEDGEATAAVQLEQSYAGHIGRAIEPAIAPLGYDWRIGVGIIASFAAREVIVASLSQVFAFEAGEEDLDGLGDRIAADRQPDGTPTYTLASALSLLVFYVFALQCVSTLAVMKRETGGWAWPVFGFVYLFVLAWAGAWLTYRLALAAGLG